MSWKDWFSSKSYRQATIKHAKNAKPYLKETAIAAVAIIGGSAIYLYNRNKKIKEMEDFFQSPAAIYICNDSCYDGTLYQVDYIKKYGKTYLEYKYYLGIADPYLIETQLINHLKKHNQLDYLILNYSYRYTKIAAKSILGTTAATAALTTGIQIFKVTYDGEHFTTGISESWKQICDATYGAKEMTCCAGNLVGYLGAVIAIDGIYDHLIVPNAGDILHLH